MARVKLLIDTDIFVDYLNTGFLSPIFEDKSFEVYYSIVTKKELLSKRGLKEAERQGILLMLKSHRLIPLDDRTTQVYSDLRHKYPFMGKEDALIAASALSRKLPLVTRNLKHYKHIEELRLFSYGG